MQPSISDPSQLRDFSSALKARWDRLRSTNPRTRIRAAADELGVSELALLETGLATGVTRLDVDFDPFLEATVALGRVMALTRNDTCVIETNGEYGGIANFGHAAQVVSPGVDLRIFPSHWVHAYLVEKEGGGRGGRSIQVFDAHGAATHKIFALDEQAFGAFEDFGRRFRAADQEGVTAPEPSAEREPERLDEEVDREGLLDAWASLTDTHDFHRILHSFQVSRTQALRLAEGRFTRRVATTAARDALEAVAASETPIMAFVGNKGTIQIFSGVVGRTVMYESWFNVMDPDFNLHLDQPGISSAWVVQKNGERGLATSLELYDAQGTSVLMLFGVRKPGADHGPAWEAVTDELS